MAAPEALPLEMAADAEAVTETAEEAETVLQFSQRVLDRMAETADDPFHNFPTSFGPHIIENGDIGILTGDYVQYELPGTVNGIAGTYEVGGDWAGDVFEVTHWFFNPL